MMSWKTAIIRNFGIFAGATLLFGCGRMGEFKPQSQTDNLIRVFNNGNGKGNGNGHGNGNGNGHGHKPSPVPSYSPAPTQTPIPTVVPSPSPVPSYSPIPTAIPSPIPTATPIPTPIADNQAPSVPAGLSQWRVSTDSLYIGWVASTDNVGVAGYTVYRNGNPVLPQYPEWSKYAQFSDSGLSPDTMYFYEVEAYDTAGNVSARSASFQITTLSPPVPLADILASANQVIDSFSEVQYLAEFAVNGYQWPTYGNCSGSYCPTAHYLFREGPRTIVIKENGIDQAVVSQGVRETQFNLSRTYSQLYLTLGGTNEDYRLTFGNDDHASPIPNADSASLSYETNIDLNAISELVLVISNIDNHGMNIQVEVSDGVHAASLMKEDVSGYGSQKLMSFPLASMSGIGNLGPVITKVKLTLYSGGYGLDSGYSAFFAR